MGAGESGSVKIVTDSYLSALQFYFKIIFILLIDAVFVVTLCLCSRPEGHAGVG